MPKMYCKKCGQPLTEELTIIENKFLFQEVSISGNFEGDFIPKGKIYYNNGKIVPEFKNSWLSGLKNKNDIWNHYDINKLSVNCCSLDGSAGINSTCFKSHEVATLISDCFMLNFIAWDPEKTELK